MLEDEFLEAGDELLSGDLAVLVLVHLRVQLVPNAVTRGLRRAIRNSKGALSDDEAAPKTACRRAGRRMDRGRIQDTPRAAGVAGGGERRPKGGEPLPSRRLTSPDVVGRKSSFVRTPSFV